MRHFLRRIVPLEQTHERSIRAAIIYIFFYVFLFASRENVSSIQSRSPGFPLGCTHEISCLRGRQTAIFNFPKGLLPHAAHREQEKNNNKKVSGKVLPSRRPWHSVVLNTAERMFRSSASWRQSSSSASSWDDTSNFPTILPESRKAEKYK